MKFQGWWWTHFKICSLLCSVVLYFHTCRAITSAESFRESGHNILVIAERPCVDLDEVIAIASPPKVEGQNYFLFDNYTALQSIAPLVAGAICNRDNPAPGWIYIFLEHVGFGYFAAKEVLCHGSVVPKAIYFHYHLPKRHINISLGLQFFILCKLSDFSRPERLLFNF